MMRLQGSARPRSRSHVGARHATWAHTGLHMQAQLSHDLVSDEAVLTDIDAQSQSALGARQPTRATNQLLVLQAKQVIQAQRL